MVLLGFKLLPIVYNWMVTGSWVILLTLCPWTGGGMKGGQVVMMDSALDFQQKKEPFKPWAVMIQHQDLSVKF